jgi:hypothetical protein
VFYFAATFQVENDSDCAVILIESIDRTTCIAKAVRLVENVLGGCDNPSGPAGIIETLFRAAVNGYNVLVGSERSQFFALLNDDDAIWLGFVKRSGDDYLAIDIYPEGTSRSNKTDCVEVVTWEDSM